MGSLPLPDLVQLHRSGGYSSELEDAASITEAARRKLEKEDSKPKPPQNQENKMRIWRTSMLAMDAYSRHKQFVNDVMLYYNGESVLKQMELQRKANEKTDWDVLREEHRFIRTEEDDKVGADEDGWRKRMARKYYDRLFKEYCIVDMSRYKEGKFGMRWRVESEVVIGKGQFSCANKICDSQEGLQSFEVPFTYNESGERKTALVKLRVCSQCAKKLGHKFPHAKLGPPKKRSHTTTTSSTTDKSDESTHKRKRRRKSHGSDEDSATRDDTTEEPTTQSKDTDQANAVSNDVWRNPPKAEASLEDEFDQYFQDICGDMLA